MLQGSNYSEIEVLYEDNHLIIVNKSASDIVQGDRTGDVTMPDTIKEFLKTSSNYPTTPHFYFKRLHVIFFD